MTRLGDTATTTADPDEEPHRFEMGTFDCTLVDDGSYAYPILRDVSGMPHPTLPTGATDLS